MISSREACPTPCISGTWSSNTAGFARTTIWGAMARQAGNWSTPIISPSAAREISFWNFVFGPFSFKDLRNRGPRQGFAP
eukprot:scaffold8243_cov129-Isochrysis_galbana.AAC.1